MSSKKDMQTLKKITITGDLGSGKSRVGKILQARLGVKYYSTGSLQREMAKAKGMTTLEFNRYAEANVEIDAQIDALSQEMAEQPTSFILDARLGWYFVPQAFKVYLAVQSDIAARRIYEDTSRRNEHYNSLAEARTLLQLRKKSEWERFKHLYHVDLLAAEHYNMIIDTSYVTPNEVVDCLLERVDQHYLDQHHPKESPEIKSSSQNNARPPLADDKHAASKIATYFALPCFLQGEIKSRQTSKLSQRASAAILEEVLQKNRHVHCFYEQYEAIYTKYMMKQPINEKLFTIATVFSKKVS